MDVLYIGKFYPKQLIKSLKEDSRNKAGGMSNHNFEMSIINGLCYHKDVILHCLTLPEVYSFPYNNKRFYTSTESYDYKSAPIFSVGFCNLPIVKEIWSIISLAFNVIKQIYAFKSNNIAIIINTPDYKLLNAVRIAKCFTSKKVTQTIIIPDIPSMLIAMNKPHPIKGAILKMINNSSMKMTSKSEGLVLLTEGMMDFINDKSVPHILMEGIVDVHSMDVSKENTISDKEIILYTGTLLKIFGIMNLVEAFQKIKNESIELWICGTGDSKEQIEQAAKLDNRIRYLGLVDSKTALSLQRRATILVNPRTSEGEYTKYSFPSKTMEYLLAAKTVVINRLEGIPEEYYQYVYTPVDESVDALKECIEAVLDANKEERCRKADEGRRFVIDKKNSRSQTSRILDMIKKY